MDTKIAPGITQFAFTWGPRMLPSRGATGNGGNTALCCGSFRGWAGVGGSGWVVRGAMEQPLPMYCDGSSTLPHRVRTLAKQLRVVQNNTLVHFLIEHKQSTRNVARPQRIEVVRRLLVSQSSQVTQ